MSHRGSRFKCQLPLLRDWAAKGVRLLGVRAVAADGAERAFEVIVRVDTPAEAEYYRHGGILRYVLRQLAGDAAATARG